MWTTSVTPITRAHLCVLTTVIFSVTLLGALAVFGAPPPKTGPAALPEAGQTGPKALYTEKCSTCHDLPDPVEKAYSKAKWKITVARMLNEYKASETISKPQAAQIVEYLGTFSQGGAPAPQTPPRSAVGSASATTTDDIWDSIPATSHVFTFSGSAALSGLTPTTAGVVGNQASWRAIESIDAPNESVVRVTPIGANPDRFPLLLADNYSSRDLDTTVKFHIKSGKASPAAGIVVGYRDPANYDLLRFNASAHNLALIQVRGTVHTTLRTVDVAPATTDDTATTPLGWHILRVQARKGQIRAWLDLNKLVSVDDPDYTGGKVGLWTQGDTVADFGDWSIDLYDPHAAGLPSS